MHEDPDQELQSSRIPDSALGVWREGKERELHLQCLKLS